MGSIALGNHSPRSGASRVVRRMIENGTWSRGERIPGEEQLCQDLSVSRRTIRAVLEELEGDGLIEGRGRKGRFVVWEGQPRLTLLARTIVVVTYTEGRIDPMAMNGYLASLDAGVLFEIGEQGYSSLVIPERAVHQFPIEEVISNRPMGIVAVEPALHNPAVEQLLRDCAVADLPIVLNTHHTSLLGFDRVVSDHRVGARLLTESLLREGCRRILLIQADHPSADWPERKIAGYHEAMRAAGIDPLPVLQNLTLTQRVEADPDVFETRARQYAGALVEHLTGPERVDAIMVMSDSDLFPVARACHLFGLDPQRDMLLAGFDNYWQTCHERHFCDVIPRFTVDKQNHFTGRMVVRLLLERLHGQLSPEAQCRFTPPRVVALDPHDPTLALVPGAGSSTPLAEEYVHAHL